MAYSKALQSELDEIVARMREYRKQEREREKQTWIAVMHPKNWRKWQLMRRQTRYGRKNRNV